ncbi:MAG TPA: ABC transporter substrate-binding protein [Acidimicrobiales bacterium]|nr:ABC transporter substrate-binding protein [Acidimicrobiales bacterium]
MNRRAWRWLAVLMAFGLIAAACGDDDDDGGASGDGDGGVSSESFLERAEAGEFDGTTVVGRGSFTGEDAERFAVSMEAFEEATGIDVQYTGSGDFEAQITIDVEGGNAPDIAMIAQPGLFSDLARNGDLVALDGTAIEAVTQDNYAETWLNLGTVDDSFYGPFFRVNMKSLVWYPVPEFADAGYEIPETWDEMIALSDQMVADGNTPWCIGIESESATGWVATDWVEDIMLRTVEPEVYDQWVANEVPFTDERVKNAVELMGEIWLNEDYVLGGTDNILTVPFGNAQDPMFQETPQCWMHRQASFITGFFPEGTVVGQDGDTDAFYLPPIDESLGSPVLGAGDVVAIFDGNDRPEVLALVEYLATPEAAEGWASFGGFTSPNQNFDISIYPEGFDQTVAEFIVNADTFRFDASDVMPAAVGAGTFWSGMVDYVNGGNLDSILQEIDDSWPSS